MSTGVEKGMTARFDLDHRAVGIWTLRLMGLLALLAFAAGTPGLWAIARSAGMPVWTAGLIPAVVDGGLILMAVSAAVARQRQAPAGLMWLGVLTFTGLSVAAQIAHVLSTATVTGYGLGVAVALGMCPPIVTLWATESALRLVTTAPTVKRTRRRAAAPSPESGVGTPTQSVGSSAASEGSVPNAAHTGTAPTKARADRDALKAEAMFLLEGGATHREVAATLGVGKTTITRWAASAA